MPKEERPSRKDYAVHIDAQHYDKMVLIKKQKGFIYDYEALHDALDSEPLLSPELVKELGNVFIEGTIPEKLSFVVHRYVEINEKFPYLTTQGKEITPQDAGFPQCPFIEVVYWNNKFIGFSCMAIKPLAFKLHTRRLKMPKESISMIESLTFQAITSEICWRCVVLRREAGTGLGSKGLPTLEQIENHNMRMKEQREREKPQPEREITNKLEKAGLRPSLMTYQKTKEVFKILRYDKETQKWKGKSKASELTGIDRKTIDKLLKALPNGID
jgi:hypothetical protein